MKICDVRQDKLVRFEDLELGKLFHEPIDDITGLKIELVYVKEGDVHGKVNYANIATGEVGYYSTHTEVEPLNATVYIE